MIARILIYILLAIVLPDAYVYMRYLRRRDDLPLWIWLLWWAPGVLMICYTLGLALVPDFAPDHTVWLNTYLFLLGLIVVPKFVFTLCSLLGRMVRHLLGLRRNWGNYVGLLLSLCLIYILLRGSMVEVNRLKVRHVDLTFDALPKAFDGYRIVQFSDAHVGTLNEELLRHAVDSMCAQNADLIVFTGDLQNKKPDEVGRYRSLLAMLRACDGVYSVLGNHDYSMYIDADDAVKRANERQLIRTEAALGWRLLRNEHVVLRRGCDSIVIAGEENDGGKRFPCKGNIRKTLAGVQSESFVVMLQHDPSSWRRSILPDSHAQLTLSGHTHGGQISLFGFRPIRLTVKEDLGLYREGSRCLYVTAGLGGFVPFRYGVPPEVVVFTLHSAHP